MPSENDFQNRPDNHSVDNAADLSENRCEDSISQEDDTIEAAFDEFSKAWLKDNRLDPEAFCKQHPECDTSALFSRIDDFLFVMGGLASDEHASPFSGGGGSILSGTGDSGPHEENESSLSGKVLGDFRIVREIGHGGMGVVYEAEQLSLNRMVALKVLPAHFSFSERAVSKFQREAEAGGRQAHHGIVSVFAVGQDDGVHYIAQELVGDGLTLADRLDSLRNEGASLPVGYFRKVTRLICHVAEALSHAHAAGVIHRDVKPSNILLTREGRPKVTDFGLARIEGGLALTRTGDVSGTPYYMSPEQAAGRKEKIGFGTDIYSLGVTLYEALTLTLPFDGENSHQVMKKILSHEPADPRKHAPRLPLDLSVICLKAMEKSPERRYATMDDLKHDLDRYLAGEVIRAKPSGAVTRVMKRVRRNPTMSVAVGTALVAVMSLILVVPWFLFSLERNNKESAMREKQIAERESIKSDGQRLLARSTVALSEDPALALLLAMEGAKRTPGKEANEAILTALGACKERRALFEGPPVNYVAFSPDGRTVAMAGADWVARIVDAKTGKVKHVLDGHGGPVNSAIFNHDGKRVITASDDDTARIWDPATGEELVVFDRHTSRVRFAAFSPDGMRAVTASEDMTAWVWDAETGEGITRLIGHRWAVNTAEFSPDGSKVLTACDDMVARIWDAANGELLIQLEGHAGEVSCALFSDDGKKVVTASRDCTVRIWNIEVPSLPVPCDTIEAITEHAEPITSLALNPAGDRLLAASEDGVAACWDITKPSKARIQFKLQGNMGAIDSIALSPGGGPFVVTASQDNTVRLWKTALSGKRKGWRNIHVSSCGTRSLLQSVDGRSVQPWDETRGCALFNPRNAGDWNYKGAKYCSGIDKLVLCNSHHDIEIWDLNTNSMQIHERMHSKDIYCLTVSQDQRIGMTASNDGTAKVWDTTFGKPLYDALDHGEGSRVVYADFFPDGNTILTLTRDRVLHLWQKTNDGYEEKRPIANVIWAQPNPDGEKVLIVHEDGRVLIHDRTLNDQPMVLKSEAGFSHAIFRPGGQEILTVSKNDEPVLWDWKSARVKTRYPTTGVALRNQAFSETGSHLALAWNDGTLQLYDVAADLEVYRMGFEFSNFGMRFSDRDDLLYIIPLEGNLIACPLNPLEYAEKVKPRELTPEERSNFRIPGSENSPVVQPGAGEGFAEWAKKLQDRCRKLVMAPDGTPRNSIDAFRFASTLRQIDSNRKEYLKLLGMAYYRADYFQTAISILDPFAGSSTDPDSADPECELFRAMAYMRLSETLSDEKEVAQSIAEAGKHLSAARHAIDRAASMDGRSMSTVHKVLIKAESLIDPEPETQRKLDTETVIDADESDPCLEMEPLCFVVIKKDSSNTKRSVIRKYEAGRDPPYTTVVDFELCDIGRLCVSRDKRKRLCYLKTMHGNRKSHIMVLDLEQGTSRQIYEFKPSTIVGLGWHPSGRKIYFDEIAYENNVRSSNIYWIDPDKGPEQKPVLLLNKPGQETITPSVSPDGRTIYFLHYAGHSEAYAREIWAASLSTDGTRIYDPFQISLSACADYDLDLSSDSRFLYHARQGHGRFGWLLRRDVGTWDFATLINTRDLNEQHIRSLAVSDSGFVAYCVMTQEGLVMVRMLSPDGEPVDTLPFEGRKVSDLVFLN